MIPPRWWCHDEGDLIIVVPEGEEHEERSEFCPCGPTLDDSNARPVLTHNLLQSPPDSSP